MGPRLAYCVAVVASCLLWSSSGSRADQGSPAPGQASSNAPQARAEGAPLTPATAVHGPMALHWVRLPGAEDCISGDALAREVERKLQRAVFPAARDSEVLIEGHVQRGPEGYRAQLHMSRGDGPQLGSRVLNSSADNCRELSETLSVVLAVMIDPDAEGHVRPLEPEKPSARPAPEKAPAEPRAANDLLAFARVLVGKVLPETAVGVGAAYERALGAAGGLRIEGVSFFEQRSSRTYDDIGRAAVDLRLAYAGAAYCPLWLAGARLRLAGCAGVELGLIRAEGVKVADATASNRLWLSGSAALRFSVILVARLELQAAASFVGSGKRNYWVSVSKNDVDTRDERIAGTKGYGAAFDLGLGAHF